MLAYLFSLYGADRFATPRILKAAAAVAALATLSAALPLLHCLCSALLRVPAALFRRFDLQQHKMHDKPFLSH